MPTPRLTKLTLALSLIAIVIPGPAAAGPADAGHSTAYRSSPNMELVAHIPSTRGTDLELFSKTLATYRDADGNSVTPDEPVERHFVMLGNDTHGTKIFDVTIPEDPFVASAIRDCTVGQGDIQVRHDANLAAIAWQTSAGMNRCQTEDGAVLRRGSILVDISDVYDPKVVGGAPDASGAHNQTIHPSGDYLYISTSTGSPGRIPIYDITEPSEPRLVKVWSPPSGNSPHDIRFSDDGTRAYMAGNAQYRIVDTTDPENPTVITTFTPPGTTLGHDVLVTPDKAFLFLGDEAGGGSLFPCPGGAVYAYDIRNEAEPVLLGTAHAGGGPVTDRNLLEANAGRAGGCTSHVIDLNPDKKSFTIGWYVLGTRTFDFSSLYNADGSPRPGNGLSWGSNQAGSGPVETGYMIPEAGDTWSAKQYHKLPGYIFSGDRAIGFYITKIKS
ncbi:MAG: hypothetical protein M3245_00635 [Actinomycetota bacterium]|nr:hypothetical protein [Actinomycetota bacterium]